MRKVNGKYILRESELKGIIWEEVLREVYNPNDFTGNFLNGQAPKGVKPIEVFRSLGGIFDAAGHAILPNETREKIQQGNNDFLKWLLGSLGLSADGSEGPDYLPDVGTLPVFGGNGFGKGNNYDAREVLNVPRACRFALAKATPYYIRGKNGMCAKAVREALNYGGLSLPSGMRAPDAKSYLAVLPSNGWVEIPQSQAGQAGDVMVIDACRIGLINHKSGHIALCCGNGRWVADYVHSAQNMYGLKGGPPPLDKVHFFRYKNIATGEN